MWKVVMYQGNQLVLEHSQNDYGKVLRFAVNGLVELMNNNVQDFRIDLTDKQGRTFFHCQGPSTPINDAVNRKGPNEQHRHQAPEDSST